MVEAPAVVTRLESPIFADLVIPPRNELVLPVRLQSWHDRLLRTQVEVFDQLGTRLGVRQRWRGGARTEHSWDIGDASRASAAGRVEGKIEIGLGEPGCRPIRAKRVGAPLESLCAKRGLSQQQLHNVVSDAIAAKDFHLAVGRSPCSSQTGRNLVAP